MIRDFRMDLPKPTVPHRWGATGKWWHRRAAERAYISRPDLIKLSHGNGAVMRGPWDARMTARGRLLEGLGFIAPTAMMTSWVRDMMGRPQSWYDRLNDVQNRLAIVIAQVEACPANLWRAVWEKKGMGQYADRDTVKDNLLYNFQYILVTPNKTPSDSAIATAEAKVEDAQWMINEFKRLVPEVRAEIEIQRARVAAAMKATELHSPREVGVEAFKQEVVERAKALKRGFEVPLVAIAVILGALVFLRR
jgi:hypothetical protein